MVPLCAKDKWISTLELKDVTYARIHATQVKLRVKALGASCSLSKPIIMGRSWCGYEVPWRIVSYVWVEIRVA